MSKCASTNTEAQGVIQLHLGDAESVLRRLPADSIDAVVTDPPYGLTQLDESTVRKALASWLVGEPHTPAGRGFMGREWDAFVPGPELWREVYRVMKPGAHALVFAGSRTVDLMGIALRLAGFEIRDTLDWVYGSGFPKSLNVAIAIDKAAGAMEHRGKGITVAGYTPKRDLKVAHGMPAHTGITDAARTWAGWGTALKPAREPILLVRKPLDGTVAQNVLAHGVGGLNIDGCRVGTTGGSTQPSGLDRLNATNKLQGYRPSDYAKGEPPTPPPAGRWPPNLLLTHAPDCRTVGTRKVKGHKGSANGPGGKSMHYSSAERGEIARPAAWKGHADPDGTETVSVWECVPGCPVAALDAQSGQLTSGSWNGQRNAPKTKTVFGAFGAENEQARLGDTGGASRFFPTFDWGLELEDLDVGLGLLYCAKAGRSERNAGVPTGNNHPTVKPVKLMQWLVRLITPPGGQVLDPFMGSGTTGVACGLSGFDFCGVEQDPASLEIAKQRLAHHCPDAGNGKVS